MPFITTLIAITTGDYSDPEKTQINLNQLEHEVYSLNPKAKIQAGGTISLSAKSSTTGVLKSKAPRYNI